MARELTLRCDICKKPTTEIVGKMFYAPNGESGRKSFHNNYKLHLDVGVCCEKRLSEVFPWKERVSAKEYHNRRKRKRG